jgi:hypothetical protein
MGEPIRLHKPDGEVITVYTRSQAATMLAGGEWYASEADANAGKVREEPTPTTAAKLNALEGAGDVEDDVTVDPAPAPAPEPAKARTTRKATATRGKGGL